MTRSRFLSAHGLLLVSSLLLCAAACKKKEKEPELKAEKQAATQEPTAKPKSTAKKPKLDPKALQERRKAIQERMKNRRLQAKPVAKVKPTPGDPEKGDFTLEEATKGLPGNGTLVAEIQTDLGNLSCKLYDDKAPITVANFVGLARGTRPWQKDGKWVKKPLYDGTPFHRVIKGFMVQGGDPAGNGSGGPGYVIPDEIWANARHDKRGLLCMANRGPNTNGSQFFILDGKAAHLDGGYTIFGECEPDDVVEKIAKSEVKGDRAVTPPKIKKVVIKREAGDETKAAASTQKAPGGAVPANKAVSSTTPAPKPPPAAQKPTPPAPKTTTTLPAPKPQGT